jgi:hypothetical protein
MSAPQSIPQDKPNGKPESKEVIVYTVKKGEVKEAEVVTTLYYWYCPLCNRMFSNLSRDKLLLAIKLHLIRAHGVKTVVFE